MTLYEKSLKTLELPAVLEMLAGEAVSAEAKEAAVALTPVSDVSQVRFRLEETTAAKMMTLRGSPPLPASGRRSAVRADKGGMLNTAELLIFGVCVVRLFRFRDRSKRCHRLLFDSLIENKHLR